MLKAVLFDCDGVLLDSESIYLSSVSKYLETLGKSAGVDELAYLVGADIHVITEQLKKDFHLEAYDSEELIRGQRALFHKDFYENAELAPMEGLKDVLKELKQKGIFTAVVSSSAQDYVEYVLKQLKIGEYFDIALGREGAKRSKPAPDLYLEAVRRLGIKPYEAAVIEDSHNGILSGLAAGAYVIAYKGAKVKQDTAGAHETVFHYKDLNIEEIREHVASFAPPSK